jgi:hypothetical protein
VSFTSRIAYAAAHVVPRVDADNTPGAPADLGWDATLRFRHHLWSYGLGVAEAMDTAQRGMGLDWPASRELIRRSAAEARTAGGRIVAGAGTDHAGALSTLDEVVSAYTEQVAFVESAGAGVVLMAGRHLAAVARSADDYAHVYGRVLDQVSGPVVLHWLRDTGDVEVEIFNADIWAEDPDTVTARVVRGFIDHIATGQNEQR